MSDNISVSFVSNLTKRKGCEYCKASWSDCHKTNGGHGFVYCLSNPSLHTKEGIPFYKLGLTNDVERRMDELFSRKTNIPMPFILEFAKYVPCMWAFEQKLHKHFAKYRFNKDREFFTREIDEIKHVFDTWLPGPFLTKVEDLKKIKINVPPSDVVVASNDAYSTDSSTDFSSIVSDVDSDVAADVATEDADFVQNEKRLDEDELIEIQCEIKGNPLEQCWFNKKTRMLFDFEDKLKPLEDDKGEKILSLATFVSRYCKKHNIIKNGKAQYSYTYCKYIDKDTGNLLCCNKNFKKTI
jgi:hypothetical protein